MHFDRLFHALVVSGAALVSGCDGEDAGDEKGDGAGPESGDSDAASSGGDGPAGHDDAASTGGIPDPSGPTSTSAGGGDTVTGDGELESTDAGSGSSEAGSEGEPHATTAVDPNAPEGCSEPPDAYDPCGCPCCWALDCVNEDEACCSGFAELCTPT